MFLSRYNLRNNVGVVLHDPIAKFRRTLGDRYIQIYSLMSRYLDTKHHSKTAESRLVAKAREFIEIHFHHL